jgi:hypothetical protein
MIKIFSAGFNEVLFHAAGTGVSSVTASRDIHDG